jgi:pimeloyl-ACP methyl ester carboxylesterase
MDCPRRSRRLASLSIAVLVAACGDGGGTSADAVVDTPDAPGSADAPGPVVPRAEPAPCRFEVDASLGLTEGSDYVCGDLVVVENRAAPSRLIRLHFIRIKSTVSSNNATIYLDGGPGGDGQGILSYAAFLGQPFLDGLLVDGDFLVISQRGTALSQPYLDCQADNCSDFADEADIGSYNTAYNADDIDDLRAALGFDKLTLYGISYGSRLGLEVIRRHGDKLRAALIEGLVPSQVVWDAAIPASFYSAISGLNASCRNHGACFNAYGNLTTKFLNGIQTLNTNPVTIDVEGTPVQLDGWSYAYLTFQMMYSRSSYRWLPLVINDLARRRTDRINDYLALWLGFGEFGGISTGLYYTVVCGELFSPPHPGAFEAANEGVPAGFVNLFRDSYYSMVDFCQSWPVANLQGELAQPVTSAVRTLVSSGRLDPITPPSFGDVAAEGLSNDIVVVHENSGHGATLQTPCGQQNLYAFVADPAGTHDTSCAADIETDYILPGSVAGARVPREAIRAERALAPVPPFIRDRLRRLITRSLPTLR